MEDLHLSNGSRSNVILQIWKSSAGIRINFIFFRNPSTTLTKETEKEWTAFIDPVQADLDGVLVHCVRFGNTPSQVNIDQVEFSLLAPFPQLGKDPFHEVIPLGVHVIECAAHEDADGLPRKGHGY
jgi:hypothetical protein